MYGGVGGRQGRRDADRGRFARSVAAALLALAAASIPAPEPHDAARLEALELLAPVGRLDASPRAAIWTAPAGAARIRLTVEGVDGAVAVDRCARAAEGARMRFTPEERARIGELGAGSIRLFALAPDGELVGLSPPRRFRIGKR